MNQHIVAVFTMNLREIKNLAPQGECLVNSNWNRGEYVFDIKKGDSSIFLVTIFFLTHGHSLKEKLELCLNSTVLTHTCF